MTPSLKRWRCSTWSPFSLHVAERAAQELVALERHGDHFNEALYDPCRPRSARDLICQQQKADRSQDAVHLLQRTAFIGDSAQHIRGYDGVETGIGEWRVKRVCLPRIHVPAELVRPSAGDVKHRRTEVNAGEAYLARIERQVQAGPHAYLKGVPSGLRADPGPAVRC